jgi:hypothetical protein
MRNKIIFLLIFVFSFIVLHDSVLNIINADYTALVAQNSQANVCECECDSLKHLHSMFHFVALIESKSEIIEPVEAESFVTTITLKYLYFDPNQNERPPIS